MSTSAWALDLDGVIWRGGDTVPGAPEAVARLRAAGCPVAFVTNSSARTPDQVARKLASHGIDDAAELVISSAMAAATLVAPGERVLALGGDGVETALRAREAELVELADGGGGGVIDTVVVGIRPDFDYALLTAAMRAVHGGARLIGTNDDPTFPDADGLLPGNGALLAAVATAAGVEPIVAGKPHETIAALVRERLGTDGIVVGDRADTDGIVVGDRADTDGIVVGDRADTDGLLARTLGFRFGLVMSGVTRPGDLPVDPPADEVADDLLSLVERHLHA